MSSVLDFYCIRRFYYLYLPGDGMKMKKKIELKKIALTEDEIRDLIEGYSLRSQEDAQINLEWEAVTLENWD